MSTNALSGKSIDHVSLIDWAKKTIARHARGQTVAKDALQQARAVMAHCTKCSPATN